MPPPFMGNILSEALYTLVISVLCFVIFFRTREISELASYKGIRFFRFSFLFFGLAYVFRLLLHLFMIGSFALDLHLRYRALMPLSLIITAYLSTMALLSLAYSTVWRKIPENVFWVITHIVALVLIVALMLFQNLRFMVCLQLALFLIAILVVEVSKKKKISRMRLVYLLLFLFWLLNLLMVGHIAGMSPVITSLLQISSVLIFVFVYYRVVKKIK